VENTRKEADYIKHGMDLPCLVDDKLLFVKDMGKEVGG